MEFIRYEKKGRIAYVTIQRPEVRNALHPPANEEMARAFDDFAADDDLWVAIVTGAGEQAFCAGNDLKYSAEHGMEATRVPPTGFGGLTSRFDLFKPVIAAVNGVALGGGFEIALACDLIVAAEEATFGLPEPRVGLAALAGGIHRLPRQVPLKLAMGLLLTGRRISAAEALRLGIVNECVPRDRLMETAERWAREILECAPLSVRATKEAALRGLSLPLERAVREPFPGIETLLRSEDMREGVRAFAEKRKPRWQGR
ncbi:MAG: enoyl-CoA hydratase [Candidatus Binatia bacterium]|nr:MAG: enoyl-CoA hydratase [Candidatus Binatia bacterium]